PSGPARGRENLRVSVDGREVSVEPADDGSTSVARIPFDPTWSPKQRRILSLEYDLAPAVQGDAEFAVDEGSFLSRASSAFPLLRPPTGGLVEHGKPALESRLTVLVPADFQVFAGGQGQGSRQRGGESEYRFGVNKKSFEPFVLAGHYHEQRI